MIMSTTASAQHRYAVAVTALAVTVFAAGTVCGAVPRVSVRQSVTGRGARRNLTTELIVTDEDRASTTTTSSSLSLSATPSTWSCRVALLQSLPRAVFVDDLRAESSGVGPSPVSLTLFSGQHVEALAEQVDTQTVLLHVPTLTPPMVMAWLTLHTRYHRAIPGGASVPGVAMPTPRVFTACGDIASQGLPQPCRPGADANLDACTRQLVTTWSGGVAEGEPAYIVGITRGNTDHLPTVLVVTIACTFVAFVWAARGIAFSESSKAAAQEKKSA